MLVVTSNTLLNAGIEWPNMLEKCLFAYTKPHCGKKSPERAKWGKTDSIAKFNLQDHCNQNQFPLDGANAWMVCRVKHFITSPSWGFSWNHVFSIFLEDFQWQILICLKKDSNSFEQICRFELVHPQKPFMTLGPSSGKMKKYLLFNFVCKQCTAPLRRYQNVGNYTWSLLAIKL